MSSRLWKAAAAVIICQVAVLGAVCVSAQYKFAGGDEWRAIDGMTGSPAMNERLKVLYLRSVQEACMFGGKPLLAGRDIKYADYIDGVDEFYAKEANRAVPLFYALQISDMRKQGRPGQQVYLYQMAVLQKLRDMGIIVE